MEKWKREHKMSYVQRKFILLLQNVLKMYFLSLNVMMKIIFGGGNVDRARGMKFGFPLALVVLVTSMMLLNSEHTAVPLMTRWLIAIGAAIGTFGISVVLFGLKDKA